MKILDSDNVRLGRELADLQGRLALGERAEKDSRREVLGLRQKLLKGESSLEALKQEVPGWAGLARGGWATVCLCLPSRGLWDSPSGVLILTSQRNCGPSVCRYQMSWRDSQDSHV